MSEQNGNGRLTPEQVEALVRAEIPTLKINQGKIKLREWDDLEDKTDQPISPWIGANFPPIWFQQGVLWLWLRRKHPQLAYEDLGELDLELLYEARGSGAEGTPDPTSGGEPPNSPASATSGG